MATHITKREVDNMWISVKKELPALVKGQNFSKKVLIATVNNVHIGFYTIDSLGKINWFDSYWNVRLPVTHWQPLPVLPGEECSAINNYKRKADITLRGCTKDYLIGVIRCLEHNWGVAEERCAHQSEMLSRFFEEERTNEEDE